MIVFLFACFDTARISNHCFVDGTDHVGEPPLGIKAVRRGNKTQLKRSSSFSNFLSLILT